MNFLSEARKHDKKCIQINNYFLFFQENISCGHSLEGNASDSLRKHTYSNILKILQPKTENFQMKNSDIFHIPAQNIDCGYLLELPRQGSSNEYPQSMFF